MNHKITRSQFFMDAISFNKITLNSNRIRKNTQKTSIDEEFILIKMKGTKKNRNNPVLTY